MERASSDSIDNGNIKIKSMLEKIARAYGYDFREFSEASIMRRMLSWLKVSGCRDIEEAEAQILKDPKVFESFLRGVTVSVSEMFRDPHIFRLIRELVVPHLRTYPFMKIWHAGCSRGEEVFSMAILLEEEGLSGRYQIYATDIHPGVLEDAKQAVFPLHQIKQFTQSYIQAGGTRSFSDYYVAKYDRAVLDTALQKHILFAPHNLVSDHVFGEMQMIFCRNVLIYFKQPLKQRALGLFESALSSGGFLCLGTKETLSGTEFGDRFSELAPRSKIYRRHYG